MCHLDLENFSFNCSAKKQIDLSRKYYSEAEFVDSKYMNIFLRTSKSLMIKLPIVKIDCTVRKSLK